MKKTSFIKATLAVAMAVFSSTAAMGHLSCPPEGDYGVSQGGQTPKNNDIDWMKEITSRVTLNGYAQGGYSYSDAGGKTTSDFNLKRTLLWAKARITDRWSFLFMHDFSSVVQEFYTDFRITKDNAMTVRLGQFKHSYSMENPLSPTMLELVDVYSQAVLFLAGEGPDPLHGVNYGRDMGLMIYGNLFNNKIHYELAVMNGQGINRRDGNSDKDFIAHLEYKPVPELRLVVTGQKGRGHAVNEQQVAWNPEIKKGDDYRRDRYSVGAEWKSGQYAPAKYKEARPISIRAEWLGGKDGEVGSMGGYITTAIPVYQGLDIVASADYFDRNTDMKYRQTQATAGVQYWFYKKCRVQLQYTRTWSEFQKDYNWIQGQVQIAF